MESGTDRLVIQLAEVEVVGPGSDAGRVQFSLTFTGPVAPLWGQRTYRLNNRALGAFDLFLVPLGARDEQMLYQAVFT